MRRVSAIIPALVAGTAMVLSFSAFGESLIIRQDFEGFDTKGEGTLGAEDSEGASWKTFGMRDSSPQVSDQEFFSANGGSPGKSIRIIRDDSAVMTPDFWLIGSWADPLDSGKLRVSFRFLRDSPDSGFSVHLGTEEKNSNVNTVAVSVGNRSNSLEKLGVMKIDGSWETTEVMLEVGVWTQVVLEIDFSAATYVVSVDGTPVGEAIPFEMNGALRRVSFLPTHPDANVSYIDDVEVVALD
jgi:hypothetical protein